MHPCQSSGDVHPRGQRKIRCLRRRAGVTLTAIPSSGIRYRCAAADSLGVALLPLSSIFLPVHTCCHRIRHPGGQHGRVKAHEHRPLGAVLSILAPRGPLSGNFGPNHGAEWTTCRGSPRRRRQCRSAIRSASLPGGRSGLPCRWPGTAGSPAPQRGPNGWLRR